MFESGSPAKGSPPAAAQIGFDDCSEVLDFIDSLPASNETQLLRFSPGGRSLQPQGAWVLQAPLLWQMQAVGAITVVRWGTAFEGAEPDMLRSIGVEVGASVENARSYSAALEAADRCPVTAVYNHRAIHQRLDSELSQAKRLSRPMAVVMIDINNFKLFNDTYGHPTGDQVLKQVAAILAEQCRVYDILGRYGGDEFLAVLPSCDAVTAEVVAHRLRDTVAARDFTRSGEEHSVPVTLSFGIAAYPDDGANRHELLSRADANLYAAKNSDAGVVRSTESQIINHALRFDGSFEILDAMVSAVDNKDRYTRHHSEDVTEYALWIAEELALSEETMRVIRAAGLLHDVGKIGVPAQILGKPDRLTSAEYEIIKRHPELGAMIVAGMPDMDRIIPGVRSHHERWDGKGYPDSLAGEDIPFLGRLLAVADAVSAMTTHRPYRKAMNWGAAIKQIQENSGSQFDPEIAAAFIRAAKKQMALPNFGTDLVAPSRFPSSLSEAALVTYQSVTGEREKTATR